MDPMPHRTLSPEELAGYLHVTKADVERFLRETDIPHEVRGGRTVFRRAEIDEWASNRILHLPGKRLDAYHTKSLPAARAAFPSAALIPELLQTDYIDLELPSKTQSSVIRDMVALADKTGHVMDARELATSVKEREALCSTALPGGLALLHARHLAPYRFDGSFIVLGRTIQAVHYGAPDGRPTRLFFLICCQDDRIHLHTLARLCLLAMKTDIVTELLTAEDPHRAFEALVLAEHSVLPEGEPAEKNES